MSMMKKWLEWSTYIILAIIAIGVVASTGVVLLAIGAIIGLVFATAVLIAFVAYVIKELWQHAVAPK